MASKTSGGIGETLKTIIYAVLIAVFIRTFFYEPFSIPSASNTSQWWRLTSG